MLKSVEDEPHEYLSAAMLPCGRKSTDITEGTCGWVVLEEEIAAMGRGAIQLAESTDPNDTVRHDHLIKLRDRASNICLLELVQGGPCNYLIKYKGDGLITLE